MAAASAGGSQSLELVTQLPASFNESHIELAHALADAAARITRQYFRAPFDVETKKDASPVTIADKQAEVAMREVLAQRAPDHGVFGEEHGIKQGSGAGADFMWVLDPIDGTKSFITGKPLFGTLISLVYKGTPILGIIDQPILRERWVGVLGRQSTLNGAPIRTRACADISNAYLYATTPHMFAGATEAAFNRVRDSVKIPMYGCDCYAYGLLAAGHADIVCEADLKPYDYMALIPIIKGAGGTVTDWVGHELQWWPAAGSTQPTAFPGEVLAAGDKRAHAQAVAKLAHKP
eukprot:CAMPEP_0202867762 /NCGR_PEP_ID=MMETSP1391-20130828/9609_1 /ASSEMBLY_ACC=CAM_ASM_000867 /TAXON_ID=1034604 /ORGANISM="Chlamydomonas leiostraca, Strain SAG 11-49" /LENGTH=291 /DNA_ID=CAMNT_0049547825 /DNA_START=210 /DNA_END=1085 /DNA_ORIENTATION=+